MQEFQKQQNQLNFRNSKLNLSEEQKIAFQIKAWIDLFAPGAPDVRLQEAEAVAKFSNLFEILSSVSSAGLNIEDVFTPTNKTDKLFIEWFECFLSNNEEKFFKKYLS